MRRGGMFMQSIWKGNRRSFYDPSATAERVKKSISQRIVDSCIQSMNKELNHVASNVVNQLQSGDKKHE